MSDVHCAIFGAGPHLVGIPSAQVQEMFVLPAIHRGPETRPPFRGLTRLRDMALAALDLRACLGVPSAESELQDLVGLLEAREQDHQVWLEELEACATEGRAFTLATDPAACTLGKWLQVYQPESGVVRAELARLHAPHAQVHAVAAEVLAAAATGDIEGALRRIKATRHGALESVKRLFASIREAVVREQREIGVAVTARGKRFVLVVDTAEAVASLEPLPADRSPVQSGVLDLPGVVGMAFWRGSTAPVLLMDVERVTG